MLKIDVKKEKDILEVRLILKDKDWIDFTDKAEKELINNIEMKGFRKGKVPKDIALKNIKTDDVFAKAVDYAVDAKVNDVLNEMQKHKIITKPRLTIEKVSKKEATLLFVSHLLPDIKLPDYLSFKLEYDEKKVTDKEIKAELDKFKQMFKKEEAIEDKDHKVENDDFVRISFVGKIDGKKFENGSSEDFKLKIGSKSFIDNFEDQLIGLKAGDKKVIKVTFPTTYPQDDLAGKDATFDVEIKDILIEKEIEENKLIEKLSNLGFKTISELEERVKAMLAEQAKQLAYDSYFNKLIDEIIEHKDTIIEIPKTLLEDEIEHQFEHFKEDLEKQNVKIKEYFEMLKIDEETFKDENLKKKAEKRVKDGLIYSKLMEENEIEDISEEEYENEYQKIASLQKMDIEDIKKNFPKERLHDSLIFMKLIELLKIKMNKQ